MVAQAGGFFKAEGLDVEIVNLRGSPAVIQALAGGAIQDGASTFEDVLAAAEHGVLLTRFISTSELPLSALAVAPTLAGEITTVVQLEGRTVGVVAVKGPQEVWTRRRHETGWCRRQSCGATWRLVLTFTTHCGWDRSMQPG